MTWGRLICEPLSVREAIEDPDLDNKYVAVHGLFYLGEGCNANEFLLLPKDGPFDGVGPIPLPKILIREECLLIEQADLWSNVGKSGAAGLYHWKHDCIVVGQIRHRPGTNHPYRVGNLWVMLLQDWQDIGDGPPFHQVRLVLFSHPTPPKLPWLGAATQRRGDTVLRLDT